MELEKRDREAEMETETERVGERQRKKLWATECLWRKVPRCLGLEGGPCRKVMSVEVRELTEWGLVWEGTSGAAGWGDAWKSSRGRKGV